MDIIYNILPKDLAYIIDDFAKDRTDYEEVLSEIRLMIKYCRHVGRGMHEPGYCKYFRDHIKYSRSTTLFCPISVS